MGVGLLLVKVVRSRLCRSCEHTKVFKCAVGGAVGLNGYKRWFSFVPTFCSDMSNNFMVFFAFSVVGVFVIGR